MGESLTQSCYVGEEGVYSRKTRVSGTIMTVLGNKRGPILVPAAAVIREAQVLLFLTGRKGCVGGVVSVQLKLIEEIIKLFKLQN